MPVGKPSPRLVLGFTFLLAIAIAFWGLAFNRGEVRIAANTENFVIDGLYDSSTTCNTPVCLFEVKPKLYDLQISAEGYLSQEASLRVIRGRLQELDVDLIKIPTFVVVDDQQLVDPLYVRTNEAGEQIVWQRDPFSDVQLSKLAADVDQISQTYYYPGSKFAVLEFDDGATTTLEIATKRRQSIPALTDYPEWKFVGQDVVVWQSQGSYYYGKFTDEGFVDATLLPIVSLEHVAGYKNNKLYLLLPSSESTNGGNSIIDIFDSETPEIGLNNLQSNTVFSLVELDMATGTQAILSQLDWTGADQPTLALKFSIDDLQPFVTAQSQGEDWILDFD